jgi:pyruvate/2-oxoglutarate dehydrogenase complex dihydrolipoamide dehydrogenase (E3) component
MAINDQFDLLVIGSGQGGNPLAGAFSQAGKRTALIEDAEVGGTCINYGCTPTKTMVASAKRFNDIRTAHQLGIEVGSFRVDMERVRQRKRDVVMQFRNSNENRFAEGSPELIRGKASFVGPNELHITLNDGGERRVSAPVIVIDSGTSPTIPNLEGLSQVPHLDNVSLMELGSVPDHLLILGGGYIAVEFGQMFRRFGSRVTIIERGKHLLAHEDDDITDAVRKLFEEDGIDILAEAHAQAVSGAVGRITLQLQDGRSTEGSHLLVAVGRSPNTKALNLEAAGVATDEHGFVRVNERLQTSVSHIYAIGDVKGGPAFTHISYDDFRILRDNLLHGASRTTTDRMVPYVVYIDPQLGRIGLTEREARSQGKKFKAAQMPMTSVARAIETGDTRGAMKAIVEEGTEQILGAAILGAEGGEIMSMIQIAMMGKLKYGDLVEAILAHPTYAESLNNLFAKVQA